MPRKPKAEFKIVEIDRRDVKPLGTPKELHGALLALQGNLGFEELLRRMRNARAGFRSELEAGPENARELRALIKAYAFVENQLRLETGKILPEAPREPFDEERKEYERMRNAITIVGK